MLRVASRTPAVNLPPINLWEELKEMERFFQGKDEVHKTMRRLVRRLERAKISYAVVGGMALSAHGHRRATTDVDILLNRQGFEQFRKQFVGKNYGPVPDRKRRFTDRVNDVRVDILVTGLFPGVGMPGPIAFPDPDDVCETIHKISYLNLVALIELKLAARRWQDFADVVKLIAANNLDELFAERLHRSVRSDYVECLEEKRREDEFEAKYG